MQTYKGVVDYIVGEKNTVGLGIIPIAVRNDNRCSFIDICFSEVNQGEPDHAEVLIGFDVDGEFCEITDTFSHLSKVFSTQASDVYEVLIKIAEENGLY